MPNILDCPACSGPDNTGCATCGGTSEVTQEVYDTFMLQKESIEATQELQAALSSLPAENIPGEDQSIVVTTLANSEITATVDEEDLFWDASTGEWKAVSTV
jgi:hypothetical protein